MYKLVLKVLLISVVAGLILMVLFRNRLPFGRSNSSFAVEPHKEISRIVFSEGGRKMSLEKVGENWLINGKIETRKSGILFILRILKEINIKSPVSPGLFESEITVKGIPPVRVKIYGRKLLKSFLVYKTTSNRYGNIMKMSERTSPFIVYIPDYDGDIGSGFSLNELFWQPYTVFSFLPSEIAGISLENLSDTSLSFSISNKNQNFTLSAMNRQLSGWDYNLVARYLSYFARVPFEKWAFDLSAEEKKMIEARQPLYRITVSPASGKKRVLTLWEKTGVEKGAETKDSDMLLGKTQNNDEFFIMRYFDIDPLLKKRSYFFPE